MGEAAVHDDVLPVDPRRDRAGEKGDDVGDLVGASQSLGRVLLRVRDRLNDGFGDAPPDEDLTLAQVAAWETYSVGRLERLGIDVNQQRWRYNFRNRHGFTDEADQAFNRLWASDGLTWDELEAISAAAGQPDSHS